MEENLAKALGRNEPCPCKSGKKYKRCCGVNAAPKLSVPQAALKPAMGGQPGGMPFDMNNMDPEWMAQFSKALQRLPHGQMQRLQAMMQKAMSGKDVSREAEVFEKTLPTELQSLLLAFKMPGGMPGTEVLPAESEAPQMSEEEARKIVAAAAEQGKITQEEAKGVLDAGSVTKDSKFSKIWKSIKG